MGDRGRTRRPGLDDVDLWVGGLAEVTNLNGGLLGSTFNYVFQNTLENLQDVDRFYYLNRTPGMNLRTQLEGNSFAELIERNTDGTQHAEGRRVRDGRLQVRAREPRSARPTAFNDAGGSARSVTDDPNDRLRRERAAPAQAGRHDPVPRAQQRRPAGHQRPVRLQRHAPIVDRVFGGNDNDTIWGNDGNDIIEGNGGDDVALGGDGNDIITDLDGADVHKGGDGNDAIDGGPGDDILMGGDGQDFIERRRQRQRDVRRPGQRLHQRRPGRGRRCSATAGTTGSQGGTGQDLLQGDHGAPFFDDPGEPNPGNDVFVGQVGENDYDAEGGDDLMAQNAAIDRNAGAGGFDWAFHQYDTVGADDDMMINNYLADAPAAGRRQP